MTTTLTPTETPAPNQVEIPHPRRLLAIATRGGPRLYSAVEHVLLAAIAFVPLLVVKPGVETSDTKTYLYLDPGKFIHQVATMWDPSVALGTVTHEYIGYLLPMGPFYWFFSAIGVPVWVAQRLWLGSILFAAGAGVLLLSRTLNLRAPGRTVAALAFMLSPYFLQYAGRISVILLPWAGLPFMVAFAALALRRGGWRYPALFAIVVAVTSGINASSIIYVGIAPILWLIFAVVVEKEATWAQAGIAALKIALLTLLCSLWWIAGLVVEAGYGVDVLRYTETLPATSATSTASEVIRGLGYWYFYGGDRLGPWTQSAVLYTQQLWLLAISYLIPVLSFISAVMIRWRYRAYFVGLVVVGLALSVGAHPYTNPTPLGDALKAFMSHTTAGLALRSTDRATPLVVLGLGMLLGAGVSAVRVRLPSISFALALAVCAAVVANNPALFNGDAEVVSFFTQPAKLPAYETAAITHLNATHQGTRVLAIPGNDFASYRWGDTVDTPQPAFLNRPFVTREQQVMGSIPTADTLFAMDDPIQSGTEQWSSLAPMARLLSAGDVLVEYDQRYEHYGVPQPGLLAQQLEQTPAGLTDPVPFGTPTPNIPSYSTLDEQDLTALGPLPVPPPLVDYTVPNPRPITRGESDNGALVVAGDANGLEDLADVGMLDTNSAIYYSGTLDSHPEQLEKLLSDGAALVVTDTNRKQSFRWDTLSANFGETETPSENPAKSDPSDSPIELSPAAPSDSKSTAFYVGAVDVTASSYGNAVSYTPEDRPYNAVDGNLDTSWNTGTFLKDPAGQWWQVHFAGPVTTDHVTLVQPQTGDRSRWITRVTLTFDGSHRLTVDLGPSSRAPTGQLVSFPKRGFHTLRITIDATSNDDMPVPDATSVGFAEVQIPGQQVVEVVKMPNDLLAAAGSSSIANRLTISMSRQRVAPFPTRTDPETTIAREFSLPTARTFTISGNASLSALIPDDQIDRLVGQPGADGTGVVAYSEGRLPGDLRGGASAAADGDPTTAWQPGFGAAYQKGEWLEYDLAKSITFDHLALQVVADGRHSLPTSLTITTESGSRSVNLPPISDRATPGATVAVPVTFPALSGSHIRITVTGVRLESSTNYYSPSPIALPLGIAEVGIPGVQVAPTPASLPGNCQSNLISIDGKPISVMIVGSTSAALDDGVVSIVPCGPDAAGVTLGPGSHIVETALGHTPTTGWDVDQLVLDSAPGGGAAPDPGVSSGGSSSVPATQPGPAPTVAVARQTSTSERLTVSEVGSPFELVLGQSLNSGWKAVASPATAGAATHSIDLGAPSLVDGFANGWQVTAADLRALGVGPDAAKGFTVSLVWTPQQRVWIALLVSAAALLLCLSLAAFPTSRRLLRRSRRWWHRVGEPAGTRLDGGAPSKTGTGSSPWTSRERASISGSTSREKDKPLALFFSAISILIDLALAIRRRLDATASRGDTAAAQTDTAAAQTESVTPAERLDSEGDEGPPGGSAAPAESTGPLLGLPLVAEGSRPKVWVIAVASILTGFVAASVTSPAAAAAAAAATAAALSLRWLRGILSLAAVGLLVATGVNVIAGQAMHAAPESSNWPSAYETAGLLAWMAVVALGSDVVVSAVRRRAAANRAGPEDGASEPTNARSPDRADDASDPVVQSPRPRARAAWIWQWRPR